jgi:hypothetical protein
MLLPTQVSLANHKTSKSGRLCNLQAEKLRFSVYDRNKFVHKYKIPSLSMRGNLLPNPPTPWSITPGGKINPT